MSVSTKELKKLVKEAISESQKEEHVHTPSREEVVKTNVDIICKDGECYAGVIEKMLKESQFECEDCGLPLGSKEMVEQIKKCPNCGSTESKKIEREEE